MQVFFTEHTKRHVLFLTNIGKMYNPRCDAEERASAEITNTTNKYIEGRMTITKENMTIQ